MGLGFKFNLIYQYVVPNGTRKKHTGSTHFINIFTNHLAVDIDWFSKLLITSAVSPAIKKTWVTRIQLSPKSYKHFESR